MVGYLVEHTVHILRPYAVKYLSACIVAEPVTARHPYGVAVHVDYLRILVYVKPVVVILIGSSLRGNARRDI